MGTPILGTGRAAMAAVPPSSVGIPCHPPPSPLPSCPFPPSLPATAMESDRSCRRIPLPLSLRRMPCCRRTPLPRCPRSFRRGLLLRRRLPRSFRRGLLLRRRLPRSFRRTLCCRRTLLLQSRRRPLRWFRKTPCCCLRGRNPPSSFPQLVLELCRYVVFRLPLHAPLGL